MTKAKKEIESIKKQVPKYSKAKLIVNAKQV